MIGRILGFDPDELEAWLETYLQARAGGDSTDSRVAVAS